ncbi:YhcN/YlaJ family sporulation lipoprotein [Alkalihalobacterium chitinilyticum]|uniref:YhcN/YlaJ family sporulation lipoprotein n=1 Tax=Alkalihalobacterium chitinilyticum TaxID=2980103 RepID=A0ABT5VBE2_9BACI|nr:YhcN/YlaJ family sporulation lipoprotein [Alkalihalobacterium chitinilyticum]MDE5412017.1 YhcN/YlaJ family sporulation lipoprotein [Alkalihalobacterium chitinilyticum]
MKKFSLFILTFFTLVCMQVGCGQMNLQQQEQTPLFIGQEAIVDQTQADNAKKIVLSMDEVIEVRGVANQDNIYIAPAVKHFDRLHLEGIRKDGFERVKKRYPNSTIFLSTDKKIFMELEKLERQLKQERISKEELDKRLKKLEEDMKG